MSNPPADPNLWANPEPPAPKKSKALRNWLIGCGGCFAIAVIAFVVVVFVGGSWLKKKIDESKDPVVAWGRVQTVLPFEAQPVQAEVKAAFEIMGLTNLAFVDKRNEAFVHVMKMPSQGQEDFDQLFDPQGSANSGVFGIGAAEGAVAGELDLQGRTVRTLYFRGRTNSAGGENRHGKDMQQLRIDLSSIDGNRILMHYALPSGSPEELRDAAIEFLSEFKLGAQN
jgi:hypothetical protein